MKLVALGDVAALGSGGTPKRSVNEYFGDGTPWISIADLNDGIVHQAKESLTAAGIANSSAKIVPPGTLLIAMYGSIGKLGIAGTTLCTSQAIAFVRPVAERVDRRYLFHYLLSQRSQLQALGRGGTQMNIGQGDLKAWPVPLPPLDEQRRIAAILDHADALRAKRRQVIANLDELAQSIFVDCFGSNIDGTSALLGEVALVTSGITKGRKTSAPTSPVPFLAVVNVQAGHLNMDVVKEIDATAEEVERYALRDGDLVLTEGGDPDKLGRGTVWRDELPLCLHQNHIFRVRIRDAVSVHPDYLSAFIGSRPARAYFLKAAKQTTGIASINMTQLRALPVHLPSAREQENYLSLVGAIDIRRDSEVVAAQAHDALFASLQSRAFRGEL